MASGSISVLLSLFLLSYLSDASTHPKPQAFIFPINKDRTTHQYYTTLQIGSNASTINVVIDLSGRFLWFNSPAYSSAASSFRPILCGSPQCAAVAADAFACIDCNSSPLIPTCANVCADYALNPFTGTQGYAGLVQDSIRVYSTTGAQYTVGSFPFQFSDPYLMNGLGGPIRGAVGLGKTRSSLQAEVASAFKVREKFALCIPASGENGSMIVGEMTYRTPFLEISQSFLTAHFIRNSVPTIGNNQVANLTHEYFIGLKSIRVGSKLLSLNKTLLSIDAATGGGGTSIQTVRPFTSLEGSIHAALVREFVSAAGAMNITSVESVAPFAACFDGKTIGWSRMGPVVPTVDFVLTKNVYWRMYGSNSMVSIGDVLCLAFVEEEIPLVGPATSVVVGGRQMENYLLEFDVGQSRLRFSPSLLLSGTSCSQFGA